MCDNKARNFHMIESHEGSIAPAGFRKEEKPSFRRRVVEKIGKVLRRSRIDPPQFIDPNRLAEIERQKNVERGDKVAEMGCAVRSVISAAVATTAAKDLKIKPDEWRMGFHTYHILPTSEEWDMRIKQVEEGAKPVETLNQELLDLYRRYAQHDTDLGNALKKVDVSESINLTGAEIKKLIKQGKQVIVFKPNKDEKLAHLFHAGYKKREIISLSDQKINGQYRIENLYEGTYPTFVVTPKPHPIPANITTNALELAA